MSGAVVDTLLHLSDTHFGTERPEVCDALVALAQALAPRVVVLSGDVTQRATRAQFAAARQFMQRLPPAHVLALPGNHDLPLWNPWLRLTDPYRRWRAAFGDDLNPALALGDDWLVLGANTTRAWRHRHGTLGAAQVAAVARRLRAAPPQAWRIVVTHHPMLVIDPTDRENLPRGHHQALAAWSAAGADLLLGGHIHLPYLRPCKAPGLRSEGVDAAGHAEPDAPDPCGPDPYGLNPDGPGGGMWVSQAGTAVSRRIRQGMANSVTVLTQTTEAGTRVRWATRWDYVAAVGRFSPALPVQLPSPAPVAASADGVGAGTDVRREPSAWA